MLALFKITLSEKLKEGIVIMLLVMAVYLFNVTGEISVRDGTFLTAG